MQKIYKTSILGITLIIIMLSLLLVEQERTAMLPFLLFNKIHFFVLIVMLFLSLFLFHFQSDNKRSEKDKKRDKKIEGMMFIVCWLGYIYFADIIKTNMPHLLILIYSILLTLILFLFLGRIDEKYIKKR